MNHNFVHLAQRVFNTPLAILPAKAEIIMRAVGPRLGVTALDGKPIASSDLLLSEAAPNDGIERGYDLIGGVAVIAIEGTLVQKQSGLRPWSGMTGYNQIRQNLLTALDDDAAQAIVLDVDSPGGEVAGCFDLADTIYRARREKPIWAILNEVAYSAAYALASAAETITVPRTGGTGSIGVIAMHADFSGALERAGINVTLIQYGARKADGAETMPLEGEALRRIQSDIDTLGGMFDALVARNRNLPASKIKGFQAATFLGAAGVAAGLADVVAPPDAALAALVASIQNESLQGVA